MIESMRQAQVRSFSGQVRVESGRTSDIGIPGPAQSVLVVIFMYSMASREGGAGSIVYAWSSKRKCLPDIGQPAVNP